jgi:transposase
MNETALIQRACELKELGKSIRQIAAELEVSKSKVFRWLNGQSGNNGIEMPIALFAQANPTNENHKNKTQMEMMIPDKLTPYSGKLTPLV